MRAMIWRVALAAGLVWMGSDMARAQLADKPAQRQAAAASVAPAQTPETAAPPAARPDAGALYQEHCAALAWAAARRAASRVSAMTANTGWPT